MSDQLEASLQSFLMTPPPTAASAAYYIDGLQGIVCTPNGSFIPAVLTILEEQTQVFDATTIGEVEIASVGSCLCKIKSSAFEAISLEGPAKEDLPRGQVAQPLDDE